jgi:hypothetical protein
MLAIIPSFGSFDCIGYQVVAVETLALRLQLAGFKKTRKRLVLTQLD